MPRAKALGGGTALLVREAVWSARLCRAARHARPVASRGMIGRLAQRLIAPPSLGRAPVVAQRLLLRPQPPLAPAHVRSLMSSMSNLKRLRRLEESANRAPGEPTRQQALMAACNQYGQAQVAIRRYESGAYARCAHAPPRARARLVSRLSNFSACAVTRECTASTSGRSR